MKCLNLILAALILLCVAPVSAERDVKFRTLQTNEGLTNNHVLSILRDSRGFMWFGTVSGLNRFDGVSVRAYMNQPGDDTSIHDNYVRSIQEDDQGRLWISAGDEFCVFNPLTERFRLLDLDYYRSIGMRGKAQVIGVDGSDAWLWGRNDGLYALKGGKARRLMAYNPRSEVTDILVDRRGHRVYVAQSDGVVTMLDADSGKALNAIKVPEQRTSRGTYTYSLFLDSMRRLWVYSENGAWVYDIRTGKWLSGESRPTRSGNSVKSIAQDASGNIWIGYDNEGVELHTPDGRTEYLRNDPADPQSLGNNSVETIYRDSDGGMWVATIKRGVSVHYPSEYKFENYGIGDVNSIISVPGEPHKVYVGTDHGELMTFDLTARRSERITVPAAYGDKAITAMAASEGGWLWVGTYKGGMYGCRGGEFVHFGEKEGMPSPNVWAIVAMPDNMLWVGTLGAGIVKIDPVARRLERLTARNTGLNSDYINSMVRGRDGRIYIGDTEGVDVLDPVTGKVTSLTGYNNGVNNRGALNVNQLTYDSRGLLWVATREGLYAYDMKTEKVYAVPLSGNVLSMFVSGVAEGLDKTMWVTSGSSIYNITVDKNGGRGDYRFTSYRFNQEDGLSGANFNQRSLCVMPGGDVLAGDIEGLLVIDPEKLQYGARIPAIRFTELRLGEELVETGREYDGRVVLPENISYVKEIKLGAGQNDITISFTTDQYQHSTRVQYEYMLEGYDDTWRRCPPGVNYVRFVRLPSGSYTLKVRLMLPGVPTDEIQGELRIHVAVPWYAGWWMIIIYVLVCLGLVAGAVMYIRRKERRRYLQARRREAQEKELELNEMKFRFFTNVSHDLRTPLTLILSPVESLLNEKTDERDLKRLGTIKRNADRLLYLVNQLLDFRKNDMAGLHLDLEMGNLSATVRKAMENFNDISDRRGIEMAFESDPEDIEMAFDSDKVTKCVMNLLSNAMKYTPENGRIDVRAGVSGGNAVITVADNGTGISDDDKKHIFERFYMGSDKSGVKTGTGIGLSLVFEYVKLHGGTAEVEDNKPCGAVFRLTLPMNLHADDIKTTGDTPAVAEQEVALKPEPEGRAHAEDRPSILFVDDNEDLTSFLKDEFSHDYDADTAPDGQVALDMIARKKYSLVVTDIMMPNVDGIKLTRRLKSDPATMNIPVIMLTAKQNAQSVIEGLSLGADDYITKPFNNTVLALKIKHLLNLHRMGARRTLIEPTPQDVEITSLDEQLVGKAVKYVEDNMGRSDLTVEELSRELGMSRVHLYKKLVTLTGKPPIEFIRILRLKRGAQYLRESQLNVSEIAFRLGFNSPKYFSKYFKEEYGMLPSEYQSKMGR